MRLAELPAAFEGWRAESRAVKAATEPVEDARTAPLANGHTMSRQKGAAVRATVASITRVIAELEDTIDKAPEALSSFSAFREELISKHGPDDGLDPRDGLNLGPNGKSVRATVWSSTRVIEELEADIAKAPEELAFFSEVRAELISRYGPEGGREDVGLA